MKHEGTNTHGGMPVTGKVTHIGESTKIGNVGPGSSNVGVVVDPSKPGFGSKGDK